MKKVLILFTLMVLLVGCGSKKTETPTVPAKTMIMQITGTKTETAVWDYVVNNEGVLQENAADYFDPADSSSEGSFEWTFEAVKPGKVTVNFQYVNDGKVEKDIAIELNVDEDLNITLVSEGNPEADGYSLVITARTAR